MTKCINRVQINKNSETLVKNTHKLIFMKFSTSFDNTDILKVKLVLEVIQKSFSVFLLKLKREQPFSFSISPSYIPSYVYTHVSVLQYC